MFTTMLFLALLLLPTPTETSYERVPNATMSQASNVLTLENSIHGGQAESEEDIVSYVATFIEGTSSNDKMIEWEEDLWIKDSNVNGVMYRGTKYYYSLSPHMSFDPVSLGEVAMSNIRIINKNAEYIIYTLNK